MPGQYVCRPFKRQKRERCDVNDPACWGSSNKKPILANGSQMWFQQATPNNAPPNAKSPTPSEAAETDHGTLDSEDDWRFRWSEAVLLSAMEGLQSSRVQLEVWHSRAQEYKEISYQRQGTSDLPPKEWTPEYHQEQLDCGYAEDWYE